MARVHSDNSSARRAAHPRGLDLMLGAGDERVRRSHRDRILPDDRTDVDLRTLYLVWAFGVEPDRGSADSRLSPRLHRAADDLCGLEAVRSGVRY